MSETAGARFRAALTAESPLQVMGAITAYAGLMAKRTGYKALYLSGGGVAANSLGVPDLGISTMEDVLTDARRIVDATGLPLLVDIDTGWGGAFNIGRTIRSFERIGVAAVHMEDQVGQKRCGHRPGKEVVSKAGDGRSGEGRGRCAHRCRLRDHGAHRRRRGRGSGQRDRARRRLRRSRRRHGVPGGDDLARRLPQGQGGGEGPDARQPHRIRQHAVLYHRRVARCRRRHRPVLLRRVSRDEQGGAHFYTTVRRDGTQKHIVDTLQTRAELYDFLGYHAYEDKLDALFAAEK
jgi:methylisocitrate lyase